MQQTAMEVMTGVCRVLLVSLRPSGFTTQTIWVAWPAAWLLAENICEPRGIPAELPGCLAA